MSHPARVHYEWLQVARGIAALAVVLTHASLTHERTFHEPYFGFLFSAGNVGVDFFFLLSGFIIYLVHEKDIGQSERFWLYAEKRFTRVYPMFWLVTIPLIPAYFIGIGGQKSFDGDWAYVIKSVLLIPQDDLPILSVAWTLTHEVYFYLLFSLLLVLPKGLAVSIISTIAALSAWKLVMDFGEPWGGSKYMTGATFLDQSMLVSFATSRHTLQFFAGCLIAYLCVRKPLQVSLLAMLGAYLIFFLPFFASVTGSGFFHDVLTDKSSRTIYYTLASGLVVYCSIQLQTARKPVSPPPILNKLGDSSYSLYLIHYPIILVIFLLFGKVTKDPGLMLSHVFTSFVVLSAVVGGWIAYYYFERPLLVWSRSTLGKLVGASSPSVSSSEKKSP